MTSDERRLASEEGRERWEHYLRFATPDFLPEDAPDLNPLGLQAPSPERCQEIERQLVQDSIEHRRLRGDWTILPSDPALKPKK